jgi:hypothetical protein
VFDVRNQIVLFVLGKNYLKQAVTWNLDENSIKERDVGDGA